MKKDDGNNLKGKISLTLNQLLKKGTQYSKIAKGEIQVMILLSKKNNVYKELGEYVYTKVKGGEAGWWETKEFQTFIAEIEKIEKEEQTIKELIKKELKNKSRK